MITISNCPVNTGLKRKLNYDFVWDRNRKSIRIRCRISHFKTIDNEDVLVENLATKTFDKELVASDTLVNKTTGEFASAEVLPTLVEPKRFQFSSQELFDSAYNTWEELIQDYCTEYEYYVNVIGKTAIILPDFLEQIILLRDSQGRFSPVA